MQLQLATFAVTPSLTAATTLLTYFSQWNADFEIIYSPKERGRGKERDGQCSAEKERARGPPKERDVAVRAICAIITKRSFSAASSLYKPCSEPLYLSNSDGNTINTIGSCKIMRKSIGNRHKLLYTHSNTCILIDSSDARPVKLVYFTAF